jgi:hypothetical protein
VIYYVLFLDKKGPKNQVPTEICRPEAAEEISVCHSFPAQAGIYGSQLEFTPYLIRGWDDSGGLGLDFLPAKGGPPEVTLRLSMQFFQATA